MAELIVFTDDAGTYENGDVVCAFNARHIHCVHAQHICHYQHAGFNNDGLRPAGSLSQDFLDTVYQYRFERVSPTEVNRIETDYLGNVIGQELFGPESMDVAEFIKRRRLHTKHRIFGEVGAEVWHGGRSDFSEPSVNHSWDKIKTRSDHVHDNIGNCPHCGQDHAMWCMGKQEVREFLCCQVADISDTEANALVEPHTGEFEPGDTITDADGDPVTPTWQDNQWEHPTGKWIYTKDEDGRVQVTFKKRNIAVNDWEKDVLPKIGKTKGEVKDKTKLIGREETLSDLSKAPWQRGNPSVYKTLDMQKISDPTLLKNKKAKRPGKRI